MADQHIEITGNSTRLNGKVRTAVNTLISAADQFNNLAGFVNKVAADSDWEALRAKAGFELDAQGLTDAQALYNLVVGVDADIKASSNITDIRDKLQ